ncbi:MAG: PA2169 family four-helix-bundle protein [Caldilineaceae bacterium]
MASIDTNRSDVARPEDDEKVRSTLQQLIRLNYDGVGAYEMAATLLKNDHYIEICHDFVGQRRHFIDELSQILIRYGGTPPDSQSFNGLMNDVWMNIQSLVSGDDGAIVTECDRGNQLAVDLYYRAQNEELPEDVRTLVQNQFSLLKGEHERIHRLAAALQQ